MRQYEVTKSTNGIVKHWTRGVPVEPEAMEQLKRVADLPFIFRHVAAMPDVHLGKGATIGSVIATTDCVIPAAVGVDIGCGMRAVRTSLTADDIAGKHAGIRKAIEATVPHGRTDNGGPNDVGAWELGDLPASVGSTWIDELYQEFCEIVKDDPALGRSNAVRHLGTLGTGNHFIEVCTDEADRVWLMLHSGSRGVGGKIGSHFIREAKADMKRWHIKLADPDLAYIPRGTALFSRYMRAASWAQKFAKLNRQLMWCLTLDAVESVAGYSGDGVARVQSAFDCHHNYVAQETHFGKNVYVTRKGACRAREGDMVIIPGSMGARSFIARGLGNRDSFHSCSHGAGRVMSRTKARATFTAADHAAATDGVECRKDDGVLDETPGSYKDIDAVMAAQADLVEVVHTLKQVVCVKG